MTLTVITESLPELIPPIALSFEVFNQCKTEVGKSSVARGIFEILEESAFIIGVLIINREVDSMYIPPFQFNASGTYSGGIAVLNTTSPLQIEGVTLPLGVSLIHELGHAVQYMEDPNAFESKFTTAQSGSSETTQFNITDSEGKALTKDIKNTLIALLSIENDNVARHEAPVCNDLNLPFRKKYI
jgi:hypothetical protein